LILTDLGDPMMYGVNEMKRAAAVVCISLLCLATARGQNLIKDGGFEFPLNSNTNDYHISQPIGKWTVVGSPYGDVQILSRASVFDGVKFQAEAGAQLVDLTGGSDQGYATGVGQTVPTHNGTTYELTFWVGNAIFPNDSNYGTTSTVNVMLGSTLLISATNSQGTGLNKIAWQKFTTSFVATGPTTTLSFINGDPPGDVINGLDSVSLVAMMPDRPQSPLLDGLK
jgi:hypothetical protein